MVERLRLLSLYKHQGITHYALVSLACLASILTVSLSTLAGVTAPTVSITCEQVSLAECIARFSKNTEINVHYPKEIESTQVNVVITKLPVEQALMRIIQAAGVENMVITHGGKEGGLSISLLGPIKQDPVTIINRGSVSTVTPATEGASPVSLPPEESLRKAAEAPNEDAVLEWPGTDGKGGGSITLRQLRTYGERGSLQQPSPKSAFLKDAQGNDVTWGQFLEYSKKANTPPSEDTVLTLPNGNTITLRKLKEYQESGKGSEAPSPSQVQGQGIPQKNVNPEK